MRSMLYYPFVQPPRDVLAQAVLYWDQMGSMVPSFYETPNYLRDLEDRGLYQPLHVDDYVNDVSLDSLAIEVDMLLKQIPEKDLVITPDPLSATTRLYYGKLPSTLESMLFERGVIRDEGTAF
jgi:hypothetical protein